MRILGTIMGEQISTRGIPCPVGYLDCLEYWSSSQILHAFVVSSMTLKSFTGAFFPQYGRLDVREVKAESVRASVIEIFWDENFIVRKLIR